MDEKLTERYGYLNKEVELLEDIDNIKKGAIGRCTADLKDESNDVFAVRFPEYGWIAFHSNTYREKFKIKE
jgi:hypothetical protein